LAPWRRDIELVGQMWDTEAIWNGVTTNLRTICSPHCSHLPHKEQPDVANEAILGFLKDRTS